MTANDAINMVKAYLNTGRESQKEFAQSLGVGESTLSKWLNGSRPLTDKNINLLIWGVQLANRNTNNNNNHLIIGDSKNQDINTQDIIQNTGFIGRLGSTETTISQNRNVDIVSRLKDIIFEKSALSGEEKLEIFRLLDQIK